MALVAYDNSDSSEYEDDENEDTSAQLKKDEAKTIEDATVQDSANANQLSPEGFALFNKLPQPLHKKKECVEEDDEFLHKKESLVDIKPKSRITIPSLSDFKDVKSTAPISKSKNLNGKKSGLLSILPQPKNSVKSTVKSLIPNAVAHKPTTTVKKKEPLPSAAKLTKTDTKAALLAENSDESDDEVQNDFFSINKPVELPVDIPIEEPEEEKVVEITKPKPRSIESYFKKDVVTEIQTNNEEMKEKIEFNLEMENVPEPSHDVLDEEAIMKLCGSRGKRKREEIQIVDVNQQEVLDDARQWLLKGLMDDTTKRQSASKRKGNEPTNQQKRKHQITYLAHQAKANEAELQNQWANNRMTKRQTQSKYGF